MHKILNNLFIIVIALLLVACSNQSKELEPLKDVLFFGYDFEVGDIYVKNNIVDLEVLNLDKVIAKLNENSRKMKLDEESSVVSLFLIIESEIKNMSAELTLGNVIHEEIDYYFDDKGFDKIIKANEIYAKNELEYTRFKSENKKNTNKKKKKEDWYDEHPGDEDWKIIVDSIYDIYDKGD